MNALLVPVRLVYLLLRIFGMLMRFGGILGGLIFLVLVVGLVVFAVVVPQ